MLYQTIPEHPWGASASKLTRHYCELTPEGAEELFENLHKFKPLGFTYRWLNVWRASPRLHSITPTAEAARHKLRPEPIGLHALYEAQKSARPQALPSHTRNPAVDRGGDDARGIGA